MKNLSGRIEPEDIVSFIIVLIVVVGIVCCGLRSWVDYGAQPESNGFDKEVNDKMRILTEEEWWDIYLREHGLTQEEYDERYGDER